METADSEETSRIRKHDPLKYVAVVITCIFFLTGIKIYSPKGCCITMNSTSFRNTCSVLILMVRPHSTKLMNLLLVFARVSSIKYEGEVLICKYELDTHHKLMINHKSPVHDLLQACQLVSPLHAL